MDKTKYDEQKRSKAGTKATLRAVVAGYIVFIGYKIMTNKETTMAPSTAYLLGGLFIAAALGFGVYTFIRWRRDTEDAKLTDEEKQTDTAEAEDDDSE